MASIWFKHPFLYDLGMTMIHGRNYKKRFKYVGEIIGKNKRILDLGAGPCTLYYYLDRSNSYEAWDLNKHFVRANKKRGIDIKLKNCLDFDNFPEADIIVLTDVLHHIAPNQSELLKHSIKSAKEKVIVLEPFSDYKESGFYWLLRTIRKKSGLEKVFGEYDGINDPEHIEILPRKELIKFFNKQGMCELSTMGRELFAIYQR